MVLFVLAFRSDEKGVSWPAIKTIAKDCNASERGVKIAKTDESRFNDNSKARVIFFSADVLKNRSSGIVMIFRGMERASARCC